MGVHITHATSPLSPLPLARTFALDLLPPRDQPAATLTPRRLAARSPFAPPLAPDLLPPRDPHAATLASPSRHLASRSLLSVPRLSVILPLPRRPCSSLPCRSFPRAAPPLPFSPPPPLPSVTAVPPYRRSYSATPRAVCPAVRCPACRLLPPRRLTADPYRAAPPLHTHLTFCSTEFALMSEPSRRVPRSGLAGPERRPRVLRSSLAEPERRLARWGASLGPIRGSSLAPSACASAVVI